MGYSIAQVANPCVNARLRLFWGLELPEAANTPNEPRSHFWGAEDTGQFAPATEAPAAASVVWIIGPHFLWYAMKKALAVGQPNPGFTHHSNGPHDPKSRMCERFSKTYRT